MIIYQVVPQTNKEKVIAVPLYTAKRLYITSVYKGVGTGVLTGVVVWAILFLPLNYGLMQPTLHNMPNTLNPTSSEYLMARQLLDLSNVIVFGSLVLHIVFGGSWAFVQDYQ